MTIAVRRNGGFGIPICSALSASSVSGATSA
jgi:hypothetical protein